MSQGTEETMESNSDPVGYYDGPDPMEDRYHDDDDDDDMTTVPVCSSQTHQKVQIY